MSMVRIRDVYDPFRDHFVYLCFELQLFAGNQLYRYISNDISCNWNTHSQHEISRSNTLLSHKYSNIARNRPWEILRCSPGRFEVVWVMDIRECADATRTRVMLKYPSTSPLHRSPQSVLLIAGHSLIPIVSIFHIAESRKLCAFARSFSFLVFLCWRWW